MSRLLRWKWLAAALCIAAFICLAVGTEALRPLDDYVYARIAALRAPWATLLMTAFTSLASPLALLVMCALLLLFSKRRNDRVPMLLNLILTVALNLSLKERFLRPRPAGDVLALVQESGYSFPSGHAMAAACFFGFLIFRVRQSRLSKALKETLTCLLSAAILLTGMSRIYLGVHYFSDVLGGFFVSGAYLIVFTSLLEAYLRHPENAAEKTVPESNSPFRKSLSYALEGIRTGLQGERNMLLHLSAMALVVVFGAVLGLSRWEWLLCILLFGLVFMAELMNTAIEGMVDMIMPRRDARAKAAKDTAAGAVLCIAIAAAVIGGIIFLPKLWGLIPRF